MKHILTVFGFCLLSFGCGGDSDSGSRDAPASADVVADSNKEGLHEMPDEDLIEDAYEAIVDQADVSDPELMEVHVSFSKGVSGADRDDSHLSVKMVSPEDKNKILYYRCDFNEKRLREPAEVTLTSGLGTTEKFIDTYDGFKESLFKKSEIMDFDDIDEVYEAAIEKSGYAPKDCYVSDLQFMYFPNGLRGSVSVQSTRSSSAYKGFTID